MAPQGRVVEDVEARVENILNIGRRLTSGFSCTFPVYNVSISHEALPCPLKI